MANYTTGLAKVYRFYLAIDTSQSMWNPEWHKGETPLQLLERLVPDVAYDLLSADVQIGTVAWSSVLTFASDTQRATELRPIAEGIVLPGLPRGLQTDYAQAFRALEKALRSDAERLRTRRYDATSFPPVVFFITDGQPYLGNKPQPDEAWIPRRDAVADRSTGTGARIVALGLGNVQARILRKIGTTFGSRVLAFKAETNGESGSLLESIIAAITASIGQSINENFDFVAPDGWREL